MSSNNINPYIKWVVLLSFMGFISLGLPDGLLGVAWPSIRSDFNRSLDSLGVLLLSSTLAYLVSSFYSGKMISRIGIGWLLSLSCAITGFSLTGFTIAGSWFMFVPLSIMAGLGAGAIDAGINNYVAANFKERLMQWLHASYGIGITLGPAVMSFGLNNYSSWRFGYVIVGSIQLTLAGLFGLSNKIWNPTITTGDVSPSHIISTYKTSIKETLQQPAVWLSMILFFIYTGIEGSVGIWSYSLFTESRKMSAESAGLSISCYWGAFTIGRILAGFIAKKESISRILQISVIGVFAGVILFIINLFTYAGTLAITIIGLSIGPIFPAMVSLTEKRVTPRFTSNTIGFQISATGLGYSTIPTAIGFIAQRTYMEIIPILILILTILFTTVYICTLKFSAKCSKL